MAKPKPVRVAVDFQEIASARKWFINCQHQGLLPEDATMEAVDPNDTAPQTFVMKMPK